ncbi:MAG: hypothetical protein ACLPGW_13710 [Roseiarcus sp.]
MSANSRISWVFWGLIAGALLATSAANAQATPPAADESGAAAAPDAAAPAKPKAKPKKAAPTVAVVVTNKREVALTELLASPAGSPESKKIVSRLAPGKKVVVHLEHDKACLFDLHGVYADGTTTDADGVELCKDKTINLTE